MAHENPSDEELTRLLISSSRIAMVRATAGGLLSLMNICIGATVWRLGTTHPRMRSRAQHGAKTLE